MIASIYDMLDLNDNVQPKLTQSKVFVDKCDFCGAKEVKCLHMKLRSHFLSSRITATMPDAAQTPKIMRAEKSICEWCLQDITLEMLHGIKGR